MEAMISDQQRRLIVGAMLDAASAVNAGAAPGDTVRAMLVRLRHVGSADASEPASGPTEPGTALAVVPKEEKPDRDTEIVRRVFAHWVREAGKGPTAKLTGERAAKVRARLREGYSEADLMRAISGCCASPYHRGENETSTRYDDLVFIMRNGSNIERFRDMAGSAPIATPTADVDPVLEEQIKKKTQEAKRALSEGRTDDYDAALRSIKSLKAKRPGATP